MNIFRKITAESVKQDLLEKARLLYLEHSSAAEHHAALASMYKVRCERLEPEHSNVTTLKQKVAEG